MGWGCALPPQFTLLIDPFRLIKITLPFEPGLKVHSHLSLAPIPHPYIWWCTTGPGLGMNPLVDLGIPPTLLMLSIAKEVWKRWDDKIVIP